MRRRHVEDQLHRGRAHPLARWSRKMTSVRESPRRRWRHFTHHPAHGVDDVGFAAAVGADDRGQVGRQVQRGRIDEGFETRQLDGAQTHGRSALGIIGGAPPRLPRAAVPAAARIGQREPASISAAPAATMRDCPAAGLAAARSGARAAAEAGGRDWPGQARRPADARWLGRAAHAPQGLATSIVACALSDSIRLRPAGPRASGGCLRAPARRAPG